MATLFLFANEIWEVVALPSFIILPSFQTNNCALVISVSISASFFWINWKEAIGLSNCILSIAYLLAES
jgi:hypothetical protein